MKRLHVHMSAGHLVAAVRFHTTPFAAAPTVTNPADVKWGRDDPRVNFAISAT